ncbi:ABC transporter permease [Manganibacter manganicus]|uniref:ABC transporter permease n=1 Tax=Manganibacter manganicus TaxID=1873176 RepID=UPI001301A527|nr:ABC transporter permease [Pseudaminobacter manganicus]
MAGWPTDRAPMRRISPKPLLLGAAGIAGLLAFWTLMAFWLRDGGGVISRLPTPAAVAAELLEYAGADLWRDLAASLEVFLAGWAIGCVGAAVCGIMIGRSRIFAGLFGPVIEALRPVSSIAWVPLAVVWFGFGFTSKIFLVGLAVFLVVVVYAIDGSRRIPGDLERTASMLGMTPMQRFGALVLPGAMTEILIGARVALMSGWGTVIVAELVAADFGLGAHLISVQQSYDVAAVMATMVCFGIAGFIMNAAFTILEARLIPWRAE